MKSSAILTDQRVSLQSSFVSQWFKEVVDEIKPDLVVAIARGAVRLLQLSNALQHVNSENFISNNALPYLPPNALKSKRVLIVDDSVIFGSTMARTRDYLLSQGATVFCSAFCVDRMSFLGEDHENSGTVKPSVFSTIPLQAHFMYWPNQVRRHHDLLVRTLLSSPEHYNLDFPTYIYRVNPFPDQEVAYISRSISSIKGLKSIEDVSTAIATAAGVYRFSAHTSVNLNNLFLGGEILVKPYGKVRLTIFPSKGEIRFTPIVQLAFPEGGIPNIAFSLKMLDEIWERFLLPQVGQKSYSQAIFQLLTSLASVVCGEILVPQLNQNINNEFGDYCLELDPTDISFVVGAENAQILKGLRGNIPTDFISRVLALESFVGNTCPTDIDLEKKAIEMWSTHPWLKPHKGETYHEILGKVFICLRNFTDDRKARLTNPDASRLDVGYSYESIFNLLSNHCGLEISKQQISYALDSCVDSGLAVPKVIDNAGYWQRVFYAGENEDSQDTRQLQLAIYDAYSAFLDRKNVQPLTPFEFHKLMVTLKDLFPWLPISTRYYTFGRYAKIGQSEDELIGWLTSNEFSPLKKIERATDTGKNADDGDKLQYKYVMIKNQYFKPLVRATWPIHESRDFYDAFEYIATAFSKLRQECALLVSTCRTQKHTYNAIAFEAHNWATGNHYNFAQVLQSFRYYLDNNITFDPVGLDSIYWCSRYISEAFLKNLVFNSKFSKLYDQIEKAFKSQGSSAYRFWDLFMYQGDFFSNTKDPDIQVKYHAIMDLISLMRYLTSYAVKLVLDLKLLTLKELSTGFSKHHIDIYNDRYNWLIAIDRNSLAWKFNQGIKRWKHPGKSFMTNEMLILEINLAGEIEDAAVVHEFFDQYFLCYDQLRAWLIEFCPEYDTPEGGFPYLPTSRGRIQADGSIEKLLKDYYILTLDIIHSTDDENTGAMKKAILKTIERYKKQNIYTEKTNNDAFVVCSDNPQVLLDICYSLLQAEEHLIVDNSRMAGTRKGLSKGSLIATIDTHGIQTIRDAWAPHALPKAFSILKGVDICAKKYGIDLNRLVVINDQTDENYIKPLQLEPICRENFEAKHFFGVCSFVKLNG